MLRSGDAFSLVLYCGRVSAGFVDGDRGEAMSANFQRPVSQMIFEDLQEYVVLLEVASSSGRENAICSGGAKSRR